MPDCDQMVRRQKVLADFGEFALGSENLDAVLTEACRLVGEALQTGRAKILEIQQDGQCLLVRAGVGWDPGIVGRMRLPMSEHSSETFAIKAGKPVISRDIREEARFAIPAFMKEAGVVALANVPILVPGRKAYGLLQVDAAEPRAFGTEDIAFLRTYATILGPVIDRLQTVSTLRATEERFRLVVENAHGYAIFTADPEDRITHWYPGAEAVFGWTAEEAVGQPAALVFTPEDRAAQEDAEEARTARRDGSAPDVRWHRHKDGSRVFIEGTTTTLRAADGSLRGFLKIGRDVTERHRAEAVLRESEERFAQFAASSSDGLWIRDAATLAMEYVSPAIETIYGVPPDAILGDPMRWAALILPEDRDVAFAHLEQARRGEAVVHAFRIRRPPDGEERWIRNTDFPLRDETGRVQRLGGIAEDVTVARQSARRLEVLVNELQHRARNLLGVVTAVAGRTLGQGGSVQAFEERLQALSRAQGLLSQSGSDTVEVGALVRAELAAHARLPYPTAARPGSARVPGGDGPPRTQPASAAGAREGAARVSVGGPAVSLTARQVQNFALALHELTTNAVKYGALKDDAGRLEVTWAVVLDGRGRRRLALRWTESGVAVRPETVTRRGYGTELIQEALAYALEAEVDYVLSEDGLRCRIEMPIAQPE